MCIRRAIGLTIARIARLRAIRSVDVAAARGVWLRCGARAVVATSIGARII